MSGPLGDGPGLAGRLDAPTDPVASFSGPIDSRAAGGIEGRPARAAREGRKASHRKQANHPRVVCVP